MAHVNKRTITWVKGYLPNIFLLEPEENVKKVLNLVYNAGYRAGLKARTAIKTEEGLPRYLETK